MNIVKERTIAAFKIYRCAYGPARDPNQACIRDPDDCVQLTPANGLTEFVDGPIPGGASAPSAPPLDFSLNMPDKYIWAVRVEDVVYALENCPFGKTLNEHTIKHTNLTGGASAFAGGELRFLEEGVLIVNGRSGRYPIRNDEEMRALGRAFLESGYHVWCMGFDFEAGVSYPLGTVDSDWLG